MSPLLSLYFVIQEKKTSENFHSSSEWNKSKYIEFCLKLHVKVLTQYYRPTFWIWNFKKSMHRYVCIDCFAWTIMSAKTFVLSASWTFEEEGLNSKLNSKREKTARSATQRLYSFSTRLISIFESWLLLLCSYIKFHNNKRK